MVYNLSFLSIRPLVKLSREKENLQGKTGCIRHKKSGKLISLHARICAVMGIKKNEKYCKFYAAAQEKNKAVFDAFLVKFDATKYKSAAASK